MIKTILKSILAGICISIGCIVYASIDNKIVGAVLFSTGLISILQYELCLFTGRIGLVHTIDDIIDCFIVLFGNMVGCILTKAFVWFSNPALYQQLLAIYEKKSAYTLQELFLLAIPCGVLMLFATKEKNVILAIFCVAVFILAGFEHSVADSFYLATLSQSWLIYVEKISVIVLGNTVGAIVANRIIES